VLLKSSEEVDFYFSTLERVNTHLVIIMTQVTAINS